MENVAGTASNMKIAYLILAHRYPEQLFRLVDRLETKNVCFFIHVDKKVDAVLYQFIRDHFAGKSNVHFIKRFKCYWAGFGIAQATLQGIKEIVESGLDVDYIALMSGQDYPIKSNAFIQQYLSDRAGTSFIEHLAYPHHSWESEKGGLDRVEKWHFVRQNFCHSYPNRDFFGKGKLRYLNPIWNKVRFHVPAFKRTFPLGMQPYGGAQFWCLYKKHFRHVYNFVHQHPEYVTFFRYVFVSDEILVQSIIGNANFGSEIHNDTLHFVEWLRPGATLYTSDKENIFSTHFLFARKFDATVDENIMDIIDREILQTDRASSSVTQTAG